MLKIYFDEVLINEDAYAELTNEYKLFNDSFYLGSTASNTFKLKVLKSEVSSHPSDVTIEDENTTFHLIVDKVEEDKGFYNYYLVDKMVNFNFNYDAKPLIDEKAALEEETYLSDILADMCLKAGVELDYVMTNYIIVDWYDSRIQARDYLSFIAELEGGYACINELGKLTIKQHKQASKKSITTDEISELIIGEKKIISRVVYDNGIVKYEFGDDTGNTLYLNQNNVFIKDETVVENIYNKIVDFEFYTITVPKSIIDSSIKAGDIITFVDGDKEYQTIAQYSSSYAGGWVGGYDFNIETTKQEETKVIGIDESVKRLASEFNREKNQITLLAEEVGTHQSNIASLFFNTNNLESKVEEEITNLEGQIEENKTLVQQTKESILATIQSTSGTNLIKNSVMFSLDEEGQPHSWQLGNAGSLNAFNDSVSINYGGLSGRSFTLNEKTISQRINVVEDKEENQNKIYYSFSCLLKNTAGGYTKISIYNALENHEVFIPIGETKNYEKIVIENLLPKMDHYYIELSGIEATFTDPMFSVGEYSALWTQASGEAMNTSIQMSLDGIKVLSQLYEGDYNIMSPFEFAGYSTVNGTLTKVFTINR